MTTVLPNRKSKITSRKSRSLPRSFFRRDPVTVARALLGQRLVHVTGSQRVSAIIVETEAYLGAEDAAAHTFRNRRTPRNESMWHDGGHLYVYFTYGMHHCMNVVAGREGEPVAVLLRAAEPSEGVDIMQQRRSVVHSVTALCSGPGRLCQAMAVTRAHDRTDLVASDTLFIEQLRSRTLPDSRIVTTTRVGVAYAGDWARKPLRFYIKGSPHVSRR